MLLTAFRHDPADAYLLRVGFGGISGPLSNINADGFAAASFHSWPSTLAWDGISGDYGPGFVGLALGGGTYVARDADLGLVVYGGVVSSSADVAAAVTVQTRGATGRRIFVGPLGVMITTDAGFIREFTYMAASRTISLVLAQRDGAPQAAAAVVWAETTAGSGTYEVTAGAAGRARLGWRIPLGASTATVVVGPV